MNLPQILLVVATVGLVIVWPLAYFGQQYWKDLVKAEEEKHAKHGGH